MAEPTLTLEQLRAAKAKSSPSGGLTLEDLQKAKAGPYTQMAMQAMDSFADVGWALTSGFYGAAAGASSIATNIAMGLDSVAQSMHEATGLSRSGFFAELGKELEAGKNANRRAAQAAMQRTSNSYAAQVTQLLGEAVMRVPEIAVAKGVAGSTAKGFALLGGVEGLEEGLEGAAKGAAKGFVQGKVFDIAEVPGINPTAKGAFVGAAAGTASAVAGADTERAIVEGASIGLLSALTGRPRRLGDPEPFKKLNELAAFEREASLAKHLVDMRMATKPGPGVRIVGNRAKAATTGEGVKVREGDHTFIFDFNKIQTPGDYARVVGEIRAFFEPRIAKSTTPGARAAELTKLARVLGVTEKEVRGVLKGETSPAEMGALRVTHRAAQQELFDVAAKIRESIGPATIDLQARMIQALELVGRSADSLISGQQGRPQAARTMVGADLTTLRQLKRAASKMGEGAHGREIHHIADMIGTFERTGELGKFAREIRQATTTDKLLEAWINGLLSNPVTQTVNITSNTLTALYTIPEAYMMAGSGALRMVARRAIGRPTPDRVFFSEANARVFGLVQGAKDGVKVAARVFRKGEPEVDAHFLKMDQRSFQAIQGPELFRLAGRPWNVGDVIRTPGRFLITFDEFFKTVGYRQQLWASATRTAKQEGLTGRRFHQRVSHLVENPTAVMRTRALKNARVQTFTEPLGKVGSSFLDFTNSHPVAKLVFPFVRTPANIFKFSLRRTPLAPFMLPEVRQNLRRGGAARDAELGRMGFTALLSIPLIEMAARGLITGGGPANPDARRVWLEHYQPYSFRIDKDSADWITKTTGIEFSSRAERTGDAFIAYGRIEPLGTILGVLADYSDISGHLDEEEADEVAARIMAAMRRNVGNKTFITGAVELSEAMDDPRRNLNAYLQRLVGSAVPAGVAQYTRTQDPVLREADGIMDAVKARTPGFSKDLRPRLNVWGEPVFLDGGFGPDIASPFYSTRQTPDLVTAEAARLEAPLRPPRTNIRGMKITEDEVWYARRLTGRIAKNALDQIVAGPNWNNLRDPVKKLIMVRVYSGAREAAEGLLLSNIVKEQPERLREILPGVVKELIKESNQ